MNSTKINRRRRRNSIPRGIYICPDEITVVLPYTFSGAMNTLQYDRLPFYVNSVYDCDASGTGTYNALGLGGWSILYSHFEVLSSHIEADFQNLANDIVRIALVPRYTEPLAGGIVLYQSAKFAKLGTLTQSGTARQSMKLTNELVVKRFEGRTTASVNFASSVSNVPTRQYFWHAVGLGSSLVLDLIVQVKILYRVKFFRRQDLTT